MSDPIGQVERGLARLGVQLACVPASEPPDPERLLLESASAIRRNPRLLVLLVTWLVQHPRVIADHRLAGLLVREGTPESRAILGLVIEAARGAGARRLLHVSLGRCAPLPGQRALFDVDRSFPAFARAAERSASPLSRRWGLLAPELTLKPESIRPFSWIREHNPTFAERVGRGGDLRCSIVEALRRDAPGAGLGKSELARLVVATKVGTLAAVARLEDEGVVRVLRSGASNRHVVRLTSAA